MWAHVLPVWIRRSACLCAAVALVGPPGAPDAMSHEESGDHPLGTVNFAVSCSEQVQREFNRAVALLHHMTYLQARQAFQGVAATDPRCAMAQWGIAMTLFQPLWPTRPRPEALQQGWEAVQQAEALEPPTERERLYLAAAEAFFVDPASPDYWGRVRRWEEASARVYAAFPDDDDAAAFYALAILASAPPDTISRTYSDRAAEILLRVHERNPGHPGAMHYLIHANDVPGREHESLDVTNEYESSAPDNPHALHMPTHIYTRLGDWDAVIRGNLRAADAALKFPAGDKGQFVSDEFPHAVEYLVYAYLQQGADDEAAAQIDRLRAAPNLDPSFKTAFHLASTQARYVLERRAWSDAARIVPRQPAGIDWDRFTWPEAVSQFARGMGAAHSNDLAGARAAGQRLEALEAATSKAGEDLFARNIRVLRLEMSAWIARLSEQDDSAVALMREAAELESSTPKHAVTPGPALPADELLGDLLMAQDKPTDAVASYRRSLELYPRRFNSLLGAAQASRALGDEDAARAYYQQLLDVADGGDRQPALREAQRYVAERR
jgi:tetratricopeptide (TPR) repeat protein